MTDGDGLTLNSPAWRRFRAARTVAHHATGATDLAYLLDMLGLTATAGRVPPAGESAPDPESRPTPLAGESAARLTTLLREAMPSAHPRAAGRTS